MGKGKPEWTYMLRVLHREFVQKGKREEDKDILDISRTCGQKRKKKLHKILRKPVKKYGITWKR